MIRKCCHINLLPGIFFLAGLLPLSSCNKSTVQPEVASLNLVIHHNVNGEGLISDTINFVNVSGNAFSVTKLEYYLSDFILYSGDGTTYNDDGVYYINAFSTEPNKIHLNNIPLGDYEKISFNIGVNSQKNLSGGLEATIENTNMSWPEPMGGGYHFLKMEGHFVDDLTQKRGYALHVGTNTCLKRVELSYSKSLTLWNRWSVVNCDVGKWFDGVTQIDLNDVNYTMGNSSVMLNVATNGTSVFAIK